MKPVIWKEMFRKQEKSCMPGSYGECCTCAILHFTKNCASVNIETAD